ncbi:MAG: formylglycine-generating enzyme family protein, partial [bacterium]|nr:formylglycine-generating enzyme family protein [bacterium]
MAYIKIPGGKFKYSVTGKIESVPDIFFCKYPVTNKRYRSFISYLEGNDTGIGKILAFDVFKEKLLEFISADNRYLEFLGISEQWKYKFCSRYYNDKRFNGDEQPVVGVSWYAARSHCFWLSCLETIS